MMLSKVGRRLALAVVSVGLLTLGAVGTTAAPAAAATGGNFVATGHDMDLHCAGGGPQCHYFQVLVQKVRNGSTKPILALSESTDLPGALTSIGEGPVDLVNSADAAAFNAKPFVDGAGVPLYSAIIVASDSTCGGCDNGPTSITNINARANDFKNFFNGGGGIFALAGADRRDDYYDFVPLGDLGAAAVSPPFTVQPPGAALGVTSSDANCCPTHNAFKLPPSPFVVLETDSAGLAETIAVFDGTIGEGGFGSGDPNVPYVTVAADGGSFAPSGVGFVGTARLREGDPIDRNPDGTIKAPSGARLTSPVVGVAYTPDRKGGWMAQADGNVIEIGTAPDLGHVKGIPLEQPIVGITATKDGKGIFLVASDGGVFALGTAPFRGSLPGMGLKPVANVVGMALDPDGSGYVLGAKDGGVFAFDAQFVGNARGLSRFAISGITFDPDGRGYLLSALDGGVFALQAPFHGSAVGLPLEGPIIGIAANPRGPGYWLAGNEGGIFAFGGAPFKGSMASIVLNAPMVGIVAI